MPIIPLLPHGADPTILNWQQKGPVDMAPLAFTLQAVTRAVCARSGGLLADPTGKLLRHFLGAVREAIKSMHVEFIDKEYLDDFIKQQMCEAIKKLSPQGAYPLAVDASAVLRWSAGTGNGVKEIHGMESQR